MNRSIVRSAAALVGAVGLFLSVGQATAHVNYGSSLYSDSSIIDPVTGVNGTGILNATPDRTVSSNAGWLAGQDNTTWANSHDNRFLYFNLAQASTIDFTITGTNTNGNGLLNPGFSIFSNIAPAAAHDGSTIPASFLATQTGFADWSSFVGTNAAITAAGGDSTQTDHWGLYRSNADFTMSNDTGVTAGTVKTLTYTGLSESNASGNSVSGNYTLGPGVYSLVVGGANATDLAALLSDAQASNSGATPGAAATAYANDRLARTFNIAFNVTPVPLPAAVWLFGSGVVGVIAFARRRISV
ncbi:MAG: hypothetical protein CAF41_006040 [Nitrospira sp. CG24A]|nr:MAG: hypothetical protein CAF41_006040 [Nitrospira sp. CG24A]